VPKSINFQKVGARALLGGGAGERHVQGISSDVSDIKLLGEDFKAAVGGLVVAEGVTLERTIEAASVITIPLEDRDGRLLRSKLLEAPFEVTLDGMRFRFVALEKSGDVLTLTFEPRNVARLRKSKGAMKVFRGKWTRQEFVAKMVRDVGGDDIPLYTPDLHKRRPIEDDAGAGEDSVENDVTRGHGINDDPEVSSKGSSGGGANLTVKGVAANSEQLKNGDTVLRVGESLGAPRLALEAAIVSGIQENNMTNADAGPGCRGSFCIIDSTAAGLNYNPLDLAAAAKGFYTDGWTGTPGGAIALAKKGGMSPAEISSAVEGNEAGASDRYRWEPEAKKWVEFFVGGGVLSDEGGGTTSTSVDVEVPYSFERKSDESTWACMQRLAEEVNFRCFESAEVVYFVAEPRLLESKVRMRIDPDTPGLISGPDFTYDPGRKVNDVKFTGLTQAWAAPPGTVVQIDGLGPANGRYLVSTISSNLSTRDVVDVTVRRAAPPLPEPAPETRSKTVTTGGGDVAGGGDISGDSHERLQKMIDEADRMTALKVGYVYGGGHSATPDPDGPWDCSAAVSRVLYAGGFLDTTLATTGLNTWGASGEGKYCTVYVRNGGIDSAHTIMRLKGRLFGTGGENPGGGAGWLDSTTEAYVATLPIHRHPPGL
jgi:hypothetical protein